jgi:hypothetical protein
VGFKSFRAKDGSDEPPSGGRNGERNFHGEARSNDTHASSTDPEARLYRKGKGKEAKLSYIGNALTENRHGLVVEAELGTATGTIEREAALTMVVRHSPGSQRLTLGADKAYDVHEFVDDLRDLNVTPHIAQNTTNRSSAIDARTTRHPGSRSVSKNVSEPRSRSAGPRRSAGSPGRCCAVPHAWDSSSSSQWQPTTLSGCRSCSGGQYDQPKWNRHRSGPTLSRA